MSRKEFWDSVGEAAYREIIKGYEDEQDKWDKLSEEGKDRFIKAIQAGVKELTRLAKEPKKV